MMDAFTLWLIGTGASVVVVVAAVVTFACYSYLRGRLPLAVKLKGLEQRLFQVESQYEELTGQYKDLVDHKQEAELELNRINAEIGDAREWLRENQEKLIELPKKREEIKKVEEELYRVNEELNQAQARRLDEEEKAAAARREREAVREDKADLVKQRDSMNNEIHALRMQQQDLQEQMSELRAQHAQATARIETLQSDLRDTEKKLKEAQNELKKAQGDKRSAEQECEDARARKVTIEGHINAKKKELDGIQKSVDALKVVFDGLAEATGRNVSVDEKLADLKRPVLKLEDVGPEPRDAMGDGSERDAFDAMRNHIAEAGFTYTERSLLAFHTSLKTAEISPLVVLAGVSGTGKSQLPRLYAEAMGMHFLNVAVQPRWDSPQDMFGFFNYMENRYKATELGCALRQMDLMNWREDSGDAAKAQGGMLLVLLDEMNLARIEYYFSELLSRLEMRNAVGAGSEESVRLASMPLELGSLMEGEQPKRLYVGDNVLFVGTMNEDETTQALSPKVMDRANVLRFGKPERTSGARNDSQQGQNEPQGYLVYEDWQKWNCQSLSHDDKQELDRVCGHLNTALQLIHRPFGPRVHQAMELYLANYPAWADNPFNKALADQLEQKIIPKLRGISQDTQQQAGDVYDRIEEIIRQTQDEALLTAFEAAIQPQVFEWHGVNRI